MNQLTTINSGSDGNAYILECGDDILLIELGIHWETILKSLNFEEGLKRVRGCLVSHL